MILNRQITSPRIDVYAVAVLGAVCLAIAVILPNPCSNSRPVNQNACYLTHLNGTPLDVNSFAEPMG